MIIFAELYVFNFYNNNKKIVMFLKKNPSKIC